MDAVAGGGLDSTSGSLDIFAFAACERGDAGAANLGGDGTYGVEVTFGSDGKACFEDVDAEGAELVGHAQLFVEVHGASGGLFAVAEGGVEEDDLVRSWHRNGYSRSGRYHNSGL